MMFVMLLCECASTPGKLKSLPDPGGFDSPTVVRQTFQLARCGCTLRVTSQTSLSVTYMHARSTFLI